MKNEVTKTYYPINSDMARFAHSINSFREFDPNRQTTEYRASVDEAWELVDSRIAKGITDDNAATLKWLADRYAKKLAAWYNDYNRNEASCPSVMISGGSNFPVRKKEKQNSRRGKLYNEYDYIQGLLTKIKNIAYNNAVKSSNPNVVELLEAKLERLQAAQEDMKAVNAYWRKNGSMKGYDDWTDEQAAKFDALMANRESWQGDTPYPAYSLNNNNQNITSVKERIARIKRDKAIAAEGGRQYDSAGICEVIENASQMRIQLIFDGKPSEEVRNILKSNGFVFSFKNTAWQRQLNNAGRWAVQRVLEKIKAL